MVVLLDVNVLVALAWSTHQHHNAAWKWFERRGGLRWATCPITELGLLRVSCNAKAMGQIVPPASAILILNELRSYPLHEFWSDDLSASSALTPSIHSLRGHSQITDFYLLTLAASRSGKLATFDKAVLQNAFAPQLVELIS